jgi:hypothetical protein
VLIRLLPTNRMTAAAGQAARRATAATACRVPIPRRQSAHNVAANAAPTTSHASYRVQTAAASAHPSFAGTVSASAARGSAASTHSYSQSVTTNSVASSSGSVIGVLWR